MAVSCTVQAPAHFVVHQSHFFSVNDERPVPVIPQGLA
jgi:hypothetical protein